MRIPTYKTWLLLLSLLLAGCTPASPTPTPLPPTPTPLPQVTLWDATPLPDQVLNAMGGLARNKPAEFKFASNQEEAQVIVSMNFFGAQPTNGVLLGTWAYVPVVPFPTYADDVSWAAIQAFWAGDGSALAGVTNDGSIPTLFITQDTYDTLSILLGPISEEAPLEIVTRRKILHSTWAARPASWAIVPFEELEPRWKVLAIDGISVFDGNLATSNYPLLFGIWLGGDSQAIERVRSRMGSLTNRDELKMTTLIMTGVTALVRGTAARMETNGVLYPAQDIASLLQSADLTHISNEIPFYEGCPYPDPSDQSLVFCSDPRYMELLQYVGVDIIELTGNHMNDYGHEALLYSLDYYDQVGLPYYAAGRNLAEASEPLIITHNGNKIAFLGCNYFGLWEPASVLATPDSPGAAACDFVQMQAEIARLKEEGAVVIATWQNYEVYDYWPAPEDPSQIQDAEGLIAAGASIVSGSQSHQPQGFEFFSGSFAHYGLGNLFFDQMWAIGTRQEFIDRHVIYDGRHISTQLFTYMLEDYSRPRPMTTEERRELLRSVFTASGW